MRRGIKILILSDIALLASIGFIAPIFAIFVEHLDGGSIFAAGMAQMIYLLTKSFGDLFFAFVIDRWDNHKFFLVGGYIFTGGVPLLYPLVQNVWQLYFLEFLMGVGTAVAYPTWSVIFTSFLEKEDKGYTWSMYGFATGIAAAITSVSGAALTQLFGFKKTFLLAGIVGLLSALILLKVELPRSLKSKIVHHPLKKSPEKRKALK